MDQLHGAGECLYLATSVMGEDGLHRGAYLSGAAGVSPHRADPL